MLISALLVSVHAKAEPARVIILRHAEKADKYDLCEMGKERTQALVEQYLGRGAKKSLFAPNHGPDAMLAMTLHTIETITPVAQSWNLPVVRYAVNPDEANKKEKEDRLTVEAAHDVLTKQEFAGKIVVMGWEHERIATRGKEITLRHLLHLDQVKRGRKPPATWPDQTYDYFWIVDFAPNKPIPTSFKMEKQKFSSRTVDKLKQIFADTSSLPGANDWGKPENRASHDCHDKTE
jgi:hypothetical protein